MLPVKGASWYVSTLPFTDPNGSDDLRDLTLADGEKTYTTNFAIPANFPTGTARTYLWLLDESSAYTTHVKHCCKYVQLVPDPGNIRVWNFSVV